MLNAAFKALAEIFSAPVRGVLLKSAGLALIFIVVIGIAFQRGLAALLETGAVWAEQSSGFAPHAVWTTIAWILSILTGLGIITGALFLMPAVTAFVGSFFTDEIAALVENEHYPAEPSGRVLPLSLSLFEGIKIALLAFTVYLCVLPFFLFAGMGIVILFIANAYLLGREYFELIAMRFHPPREAKLLRKMNAAYIFMGGMVIALFVTIPIVNFATPVFATAFMMHIYKRMFGKRVELIEPAR